MLLGKKAEVRLLNALSGYTTVRLGTKREDRAGIDLVIHHEDMDIPVQLTLYPDFAEDLRMFCKRVRGPAAYIKLERLKTIPRAALEVARFLERLHGDVLLLIVEKSGRLLSALLPRGQIHEIDIIPERYHYEEALKAATVSSLY